jgi:hypothetical protein
VRGGYCAVFDDNDVDRLHAWYPPLPYARCPTFDVPLRGNDEMILRISDVTIEWMTATDAAHAALDRLLKP